MVCSWLRCRSNRFLDASKHTEQRSRYPCLALLSSEKRLRRTCAEVPFLSQTSVWLGGRLRGLLSKFVTTLFYGCRELGSVGPYSTCTSWSMPNRKLLMVTSRTTSALHPCQSRQTEVAELAELPSWNIANLSPTKRPQANPAPTSLQPAQRSSMPESRNRSPPMPKIKKTK